MPTSALLTDLIDSPLGVVVLVARESRLVAVRFADGDPAIGSVEQQYLPSRVDRASDPFGLSSRLREYFGGAVHALDDVAIEPAGTPFQRDVWAALRRVPPGLSITYAQLARAAGRPRAIRAAGAANARNPVAIAVPCHRVVGSDGSLTGYGGGLWRKQWLLSHEGAVPRARGLSHVSAPA